MQPWSDRLFLQGLEMDGNTPIRSEGISEQDPQPGAVPQEREIYASPVPARRRRIDIPPVAFGVILLITAFVAYQVIGGLITYLLFGIDMSGEVQGMRAVTMVSQFAFLLLPPFLLLRLQPWDSREVMRLHRPRLGPLILVVLSVVAMQFVLQGYLVTQQFILKEYLLPDSLIRLLETLEKMIEGIYEELLVMRSLVEMLYVLLIVAVTPALCEEILFRGAVLGSLERGMRTRWAVVLTGATFAMFHLNPVTFIPLALLGMYIGFVVVRGGSIWLGIAAHAANNTIAVISLYFMKSESLVQEQTSSGAPSMELLFLSAIGLCVMLLSTAMFWRATSPGNDPTQA